MSVQFILCWMHNHQYLIQHVFGYFLQWYSQRQLLPFDCCSPGVSLCHFAWQHNLLTLKWMAFLLESIWKGPQFICNNYTMKDVFLGHTSLNFSGLIGAHLTALLDLSKHFIFLNHIWLGWYIFWFCTHFKAIVHNFTQT